MKKLTIILSVILMVFTIQAGAQTKSTKTKAKTTTAKKKTITTKTTTTAKPATAPVQQKTEVVETKKTTVAAATPVAKATDIYYKTAVGVKFLYGIAVTGKFFIADKAAIEAIVRYRDYDLFGSEINLTALYEYHGQIKGADGLRWYAGGGGYAGYYSLDGGGSETIFGVSGVVGLEYKFKNTPIALSADWNPVYIVNGNSGFASDNGGFGIKYTF